MSKGLKWYWSRLKCMSPSEIHYRFKKSAYIRAQKSGIFTVKDVPAPDLAVVATTFINNQNGTDKEPYCTAADAVIAGNFPIFAIADAQLGSIPNWNSDPQSGTTAPLDFGKTLNYRDSDLVGDIKYLWEPNRHLQLVVLAQAFSLSGDEKYLDSLKVQLDSWFDQCPYLKGPNWTSSLELGIRLINWSLVWQLIGGKDSTLFKGEEGIKFRNRWLKVIYQHAHFISGHLSRYSSANNHLIGEAAGLFIAATTWPHWQSCSSWRDHSKQILEYEARLQNTSDGVNREQAVSYQQFVLDFLLVSALAGRANNVEFSSGYWDRIELMMEFIASIMDVKGNIPMIGDADDGYVTRLSREPDWCPFRSLLATGSILFQRADFKAKAGELDDKTRYLLGSACEAYTEISDESPELPVHRAFSKGGYYIMGTDFEMDDEIRLVLDAGPLGYESIAAHGHADALAFTLNISGLEFLVDPGTYAYHTQKKWRDYFRGTSAHNTIRVDGMDQSESGGNFMWLRKAIADCERWETGKEFDRFTGVHDGYARLTDPVIHRREITFNKPERLIMVTDYLLCRSTHEIECFWHFSEDCEVTPVPMGIEVVNGGRKLLLKVDGLKDGPILVKGDDVLPLGWVSRRYDLKSQSQTAYWRFRIDGESSIKTEIYCY